MRTSSGTVTFPLDWPALVEETLRRRRAEGLTQKEHAALAGVSVPTMVSFDRKELTLSLAKAIDILQVVGLVAKPSPVAALEEFRMAADRRWEELVAALPPAAPGRMENGHYTFYYQIAGVPAASSRQMQDALRKADRKYTGWPPFWLPTRQAIAAYPFDEGLECWLGKPDTERAFDDPAHADFWRASLDARLYLRRGFQEDSTDVLPPATIFDLTLPIWRAGEALLHAHHLGEALEAGPDAQVEFRARYTGLAGRELKSWANPHRTMFDDHRCRTGHAESAVQSGAAEIADRLPELVHRLLAPVYELFDYFELQPAIVAEELGRLRSDRARRRPTG